MSNSIEAKADIKTEAFSDSNADDASQHCPCPYVEGEKVFASFRGVWYQAKVEKVEFDENWSFFVHYWRWKRRWLVALRVDEFMNLLSGWDEWVRVDRLRKMTEENLPRLLHENEKVTDVKAGRLPQTKFSTYSDSHVKKHKNDSDFMYLKRKREQKIVKLQGKDDRPIEKLVSISVSATLKKQLVDDFEFIKHMGMLVKLPRTPNVYDIIKKYQEYRRRKDKVMSTSLGEVLSGLCAYFDKALPIMLLYNEERQQYQEAIAENLFPSTVYGAEHLLRLFVKLPELIYDLKLEKETLQDLQQNLHDFLKFLQKNQSVFFIAAYHRCERSSRSTSQEFN